MQATGFVDSPTPYPEFNGILRTLVDEVRDVLADPFVGAYLLRKVSREIETERSAVHRTLRACF